MTALPSDAALENPKPSSSLDIFSRWLLIIALLVVAAAFILFLLLALPANDDFARATKPHEMGYWGYCKLLYTHWQGRWVSFGLESAVLSHGDMTKSYPLLIGAVAAVNFLGVYTLCRRITILASRWFSIACAIGLSAVLWAEMPSVAQAVYWFTGVVENTMPLALAGMLLVGLMSFRASVLWMIFASIFAIVICGVHESYGAMLCIALATGTAAAYWMKSENRIAWLVVLIAAVMGLGIVVGAPGNRNRMRSDGGIHSGKFAYDLRLAAAQFWRWSRIWIFDPKLLGASLLVAFSTRLEESRPIWPNAKSVPWRLILPIAWLAMLAVGFFAPSYAFGEEMPPRTLSGNFTVFAVGWLLIVFVWTRRIDARDPASIGIFGLRSVGGSAVARLVLALGLVLTGNTMDAMHDLATQRVLKWRASVEQRYAMLRRHGEPDRVIPWLAPSSHLLYAGEITTNPSYWANVGTAYFFHLKTVRLLPAGAKSTTTEPSPAIDPEPATPNM